MSVSITDRELFAYDAKDNIVRFTIWSDGKLHWVRTADPKRRIRRIRCQPGETIGECFARTRQTWERIKSIASVVQRIRTW